MWISLEQRWATRAVEGQCGCRFLWCPLNQPIINMFRAVGGVFFSLLMKCHPKNLHTSWSSVSRFAHPWSRGTRYCLMILNNVLSFSCTDVCLGNLRSTLTDEAGCWVMLLCCANHENENSDVVLWASPGDAHCPAWLSAIPYSKP